MQVALAFAVDGVKKLSCKVLSTTKNTEVEQNLPLVEV